MKQPRCLFNHDWRRIIRYLCRDYQKRFMARQKTANSLGSDNIGRLLIQYSIPAIIATASASLYNIIDRVFIGHGVGPYAISGLSLTLPFMNITTAFGALVGIGASTMVSIRLGQRNRQGATHILGNAVMLNLIIGLLVAFAGFIFLDPVLSAMGASPKTLPYARMFMQVILLGNVFSHLYLGLNNIMRSSGYPRKAMTITLITVGINLALAPIFIFLFEWGIRGAALATVVAQLSGAVLGLVHFFRRDSNVHFLPGYQRLNMNIVKEIFSVGMATFLMFISASLVVLLINRSLGKYGGDFAIGAYGIINSILSLIVMVVLGFTQGMQPIAGFNFGAQQYDRVRQVFKITLVAGTVVTTFGFLISMIFPRQIASVFTDNQELINLSASGLRYVLMVFPIVGFQMVTSNFFQSIGKAHISMILSLSRQVLFLIPAMLILSRLYGLNGVWVSMPVSDFLASLLTFVVLRYQMKKLPG